MLTRRCREEDNKVLWKRQRIPRRVVRAGLSLSLSRDSERGEYYRRVSNFEEDEKNKRRERDSHVEETRKCRRRTRRSWFRSNARPRTERTHASRAAGASGATRFNTLGREPF